MLASFIALTTLTAHATRSESRRYWPAVPLVGSCDMEPRFQVWNQWIAARADGISRGCFKILPGESSIDISVESSTLPQCLPWCASETSAGQPGGQRQFSVQFNNQDSSHAVHACGRILGLPIPAPTEDGAGTLHPATEIWVNITNDPAQAPCGSPVDLDGGTIRATFS